MKNKSTRSTKFTKKREMAKARQKCIAAYQDFLDRNGSNTYNRYKEENPDDHAITRQSILSWIERRFAVILNGELIFLHRDCALNRYGITVEDFDWDSFGLGDVPDARCFNPMLYMDTEIPASGSGMPEKDMLPPDPIFSAYNFSCPNNALPTNTPSDKNQDVVTALSITVISLSSVIIGLLASFLILVGIVELCRKIRTPAAENETATLPSTQDLQNRNVEESVQMNDMEYRNSVALENTSVL